MENVIIRDNSVAVNGDVYRSSALGAMLRIFGVEELEISSAQIEPDDGDGGNFTIKGSVNIFSQQLQGIELYLNFMSGGNFEFQFTGILPSLTLSMLRSNQILPTSDLSDIPDLLSAEFGGVKIVFDSVKSDIYFGLLSSSLRFGALDAIGLSLDKIGFEFLRSYGDNTTTLYIHAEVDIGGAPINTQIEIPLGGFLAPRSWVLTIDSIIPLSSGLQKIIAFLDRTNIGESLGLSSFAGVFPGGLSQIPTIFLDEIRVLLDPIRSRFEYLTFRVRSVRPFKIAGDLFTINNVGVRMNINPDPTKPSFSLIIFGSVKIKEEVFLDISVLLPENFSQNNWIFSMSGEVDLQGIADIEQMPINISIGELKLPQGFIEVESLKLKVFEVDFNPIRQMVSAIILDIAVNAECDLTHDLKFKNPLLSLNAVNPFNQSELGSRSITGAIAGTIAVGEITFGVMAEKQADGWSFTGKMDSGSIPIGTLIGSIGQKFNVSMPDFINGIELESLSLNFTTTADNQVGSSNNIVFNCEGEFPLDDKKAKVLLGLNVNGGGGSPYSIVLDGHLIIDPLQFKTIYSRNASDNFFVATYSHSSNQQSVNLKELVESASTEVAAYIPEDLQIDLKDVLFAFDQSSTGQKRLLFGLDIGAAVNLSNLPLIGREFPANQAIGLDNLQILIASKLFDQSLTTNLRNILAGEGIGLPPGELNQGLNISASLNFGGSIQRMDLPVTGGATSNPAAATSSGVPAAPNVASSENAKWFTLQKSIGPVYFKRVGAQYKDNELFFLLDASLSFAGLTLSLDGLSVSSPLSKFEPKFNLHGLGIDYSNGPVEIGGAFLKTQVQVGGKTYDEYDGAAIIKATQFTLSAIGSYADLDGHPSLFIYAVLDYPLGGPSFFFVTGLAAGFGYNRSLLMPTIDQVAQFPLVAQAVNGQRSPNNLTTQLQSLQRYIPPAVGETFLAVGIKFTSFKIIDSFVLLTVAFGTRFEVNLLGLSTLISPPQAPQNVPPLAVVQMAVRAAFIPDEGFLGVQAQLTPASYIFTRDCHLTGGFAFYSWFSGAHAGEFVITLGGYHPNFNVPDYYPKVPRLGLSWQVNSNLSVKGGIYYALTASTLMAGGNLQATWQDGNLKAWFNAAADFIVSWKPYHYDAYIRVNMGVSYTFTVDLWVTTVRKTISVDVSADLHIWGPEFSGRAHINLDVVSFDVTFGNASSQQPQPISWVDFRNSFLPRDEEVCGIAVRNGLTQTTEAKQWVVNPKDFCLVTDSMIPSKTALAGDRQLQFSAPLMTEFGVGPMAVAPVNLITKHIIQIDRIVDGKVESAEDDFDFVPVKKRAPAGLWGKSLTPSVNGQGYIEQALSGFEIRPKNPPAPGMTSDIDIGALQYDPTNVQNAFYWETFKSFSVSPETDDARRARIRSGLMQAETIEARNGLLQDLGLSSNLTLSESTADAFSVPPQVGSFAG